MSDENRMGPIIRVEVEHIKQGITQCLADAAGEYQEYVRVAVGKAIDSYDWDGAIKKIVHEQIQGGLISYFSYGRGADAIYKAIEAGLNAQEAKP